MATIVVVLSVLGIRNEELGLQKQSSALPIASQMAALSASVHGGGLPNDTHAKAPEQLALQWEVRTSIAGMTLALRYSDHEEEGSAAAPVAGGDRSEASRLHAPRCVRPETASSSVDPFQRSHPSAAAAAMQDEAASSIPRTSSSTSSESYQTCGDATESFHSTLSAPYASGFWAQSSSSHYGSAFESGAQQSHGAITGSDAERTTLENWSGNGMATERVEAAIAAADVATGCLYDSPHSAEAAAPLSPQIPPPLPPCSARDRSRIQLECSDVIVDASSVGNRTTVAARLYALSVSETLPKQHSTAR